MTHFGHDFVEKLLKVFAKAASTSLLIALFFILQYIFDMDFKCSCTSDIALNEVLYMVVPPVILTWILFYIESYDQRRRWDICKRKCGSNYPSFLCQIFLKFISVGAIWSTAVLLNGDWYFCVKTKSDSNLKLPCKEKDHLVDEEKEFQNGLKIESLNWGMMIICVLLFTWTMVVFVAQRYRRTRRKSEKQLWCPPYYKVVYEHLLAEQVGSYLKKELTQLATERAKVICQKHIQIIKDYEKNTDADTIKVEDSWHEISASDFYMQQEGQERGREERQERGQEERQERGREERQERGREERQERGREERQERSTEEELPDTSQNGENIGLVDMSTGTPSI